MVNNTTSQPQPLTVKTLKITTLGTYVETPTFELYLTEKDEQSVGWCGMLVF
jgi:hypothetical protein